METHHRFVLLKQIDDIVKDINPRDIASSLANDQQREKRVLPILLLKDVARQPSPGKQAYRLIELLVSCGPRAFDALCEALETHRHDKLLQTIRRAEKDTRVADPAVLQQLRKVTSKFPTPESYVDVCRNSAEAFTSDVWVEHLLPLLKPPIDPTDSIRQRVLDGPTRQDKAEVLFDWLIRKVDKHGHRSFFALLDAVKCTYPHVAEEIWNHLQTIAVTKEPSQMASKAAGGKSTRLTNGAKGRITNKGKPGDSLSNDKLFSGDDSKGSLEGDMDYHSQLDHAVGVIGEANAKIRRTEDRVAALENERTDLENKLRIALRESYSLRTELENLKKEKQEKNLKEAELRRSRERKLKELQEELETKESMMASREIELRRRELELDQRVSKVRRQQADVERQFLDVLDKDKSFEGRVRAQGKKDEELKRRDRALTVRESVIADKEDLLTRNLEELKNKETNVVKAMNELEKKRENLNGVKRKNEEVAIKLAEKKNEIDVKEKEVGITLMALRKDEAELLRKEEQLEDMEEEIAQRQVELDEKERGLSQRSRETGEFEREKKQFYSDKKKWNTEAAKIRNDLERERKSLRERDMDLKTKERELQIKDKERHAVKDALDKHLQDQNKIERSIKAIEMEQRRIELAQSLRETEMEQKQKREKMISSITSKEDELLAKISDLHRKEQHIREREEQLKEDEERAFQLRFQGDNQLRDSGDHEMVLEDVSEMHTPSVRGRHYTQSIDHGSSPESGFSESHAAEYRILQKGVTGSQHRNQIFNIKTGNVKNIGEMKNIIYRREGIPIDWQQFYFNGKRLPDTSMLPAPETLASGVMDLRLAIPNGTITLAIRMNSTVVRKIEFKEDETIAAAKTRIYKSEGIPPHQQTLYYGDLELQNKYRLSEYVINPKNEILELLLRLRYNVVVALFHNRLIGLTVEDLDTVASVKGRIWKETRIHVNYQVLTYGSTTMADQRTIGYYRVTEGSRIFVSFVLPIVVEPTKETFTLSLDPLAYCIKIKEQICKFRSFQVHLQKLVHQVLDGKDGSFWRLLNDNKPIIDELTLGEPVHLYHGTILILDGDRNVLVYDVELWHSVKVVKDIIRKKMEKKNKHIHTRHIHLMHGDQELKTVTRAIKSFGVKRSDVLVVRTDPTTFHLQNVSAFQK
ncbi:uncharacterized protein LOC129272025 [Lytechinus pictus]|uniref:uncharacterized protein LOC129272025 n=1 Tax=Lytechinus pictus TaxID=7653 RepID=UPI0030B9B87E